MPSRSYSEITNKARAKWSPQAHEIAKALGDQLDAEVSGQITLGKNHAVARSEAHPTQPQLADTVGECLTFVQNNRDEMPQG
ncbi:hypothetical protein [Arthrobacter sp. A2-55]|jgi:hypothetical protein|uniref:hypothetical protein n=1 Tax=Arthrobacter sp. A2-55 TaxID=2897337 RepID=UPI0021CD4047|nr:hypothetical protein [Arthrobacter sp. A2-55]MCU6481405.1 hypothetical protein [Arthrobacter sp. A2-55]